MCTPTQQLEGIDLIKIFTLESRDFLSFSSFLEWFPPLPLPVNLHHHFFSTRETLGKTCWFKFMIQTIPKYKSVMATTLFNFGHIFLCSWFWHSFLFHDPSPIKTNTTKQLEVQWLNRYIPPIIEFFFIIRLSCSCCEYIPTQNIYAVTQHLLTRRNFLFLNSLRGFWRSLVQRAHSIFHFISFFDSI